MQIGPYPTHPAADAFPLIEGVPFAALVEDVRTHGVREPIVLDRTGRVVDGRNRLRAAIEAGIAPGDVPVRRVPWAERALVDFVVSSNLHRRHLDESQRALVAARLASLAPGGRPGQSAGLSQGEAAAALNVGERSVRRARTVVDSGSTALADAVAGGTLAVSAAEAVARPLRDLAADLGPEAGPAVVEAFDAEVASGAAPEDALDTVATAAAETGSEAAGLLAARRKRAAAQADPANPMTNEWYTPGWVIEKARRTLGKILHDPASNDRANETVKAERYDTPDTQDGAGGLGPRKWGRTVFLNPPYSGKVCRAFCERLAEEVEAGNVYSAVVLVPAVGGDRRWWRSLWGVSSAACFLRERIDFTAGARDGGSAGGGMNGYTVWLIGYLSDEEIEEFCEEWGDVGCTFVTPRAARDAAPADDDASEGE